MDKLKMKYFVLSPGSNDLLVAKASLAACVAYAGAIRIETGDHEFANELEAWAFTAFNDRHGVVEDEV